MVGHLAARRPRSTAVRGQPVADAGGVGVHVGEPVELEVHQHQEPVEALSVHEARCPGLEPVLQGVELQAAETQRVPAAQRLKRSVVEPVNDQVSVTVNPVPERRDARAPGDCGEVLPSVRIHERLLERLRHARVAVQLRTSCGWTPRSHTTHTPPSVIWRGNGSVKRCHRRPLPPTPSG